MIELEGLLRKSDDDPFDAKKSAICFSRDRSQCVTCDHSQESAVNVILLQNFPENSLIIIAFSFCKHWLCQLWNDKNVDEHNRPPTSNMR